MKLALRSMLFGLVRDWCRDIRSQRSRSTFLETVVEVAEAPSAIVTLPASVPGNLMMPSCGTCQLKSYPVTAATTFILYGKQVTLTEFKAAVLGKDTLLGVGYPAQNRRNRERPRGTLTATLLRRIR